MKRTASTVIRAPLSQRHVALNHIHDIDAGEEFLDEMFGDHLAIMRCVLYLLR